ncbi:hypothetical protein MRX96_014190 [Rhipicephalus microplus]
MELVQSNEVTSSSAMELEGLKRALKGLDERKVCVHELVTDQHVQERKHMEQHRPNIPHFIDAWNVAKGLKKKLVAASRLRGCNVIDNTDTFDKLHSIVNNSRLLVDIKQVSPSFQTSCLESFHSVLNRFAPKSCSFFFHEMLARSELAALHYNKNADRVKCRTAWGMRQWVVKHPKARKGNSVACPVKEPATFGMDIRASFWHLLRLVDEFVENGSFGVEMSTLPLPPPPLTSSFATVDKSVLERDHLSRFSSCREPHGRTNGASDDSE